MISVIMPVYNEQRALPDTLDALLRQSGSYQVIAVDGGSTDATRELLQGYPQVRVLESAKGRASQMNAGAAVAGGEWLLFLHADTRLPVGALERLNGWEGDRSLQAGGFRHRFSGDRWSLRLVSRLDNLRCRITGVIYGDQAMFVRRELFKRIGGFPEEPVLEDVLFCERLIRETRPVLIEDPVITDSRKFEQAGVWRSLWRVMVIQLRHELGLSNRSRRFFADIR